MLIFHNYNLYMVLLVQIMILVDDVGGILPAINHSPWNGLTLADLVMPFFLFMVGVSLSLTYKVHHISHALLLPLICSFTQ